MIHYLLIILPLLYFSVQTFALSSQGGNYTNEDLEILIQQKDFLQFFKHFQDIPPSKRDQHWHAIFERASSEFTQDALKKSHFSPETFQRIESFLKGSTLDHHESFLRARSNYALGYFTECLKRQNKDLCSKDFQLFWQHPPKEPQDIFKFYPFKSLGLGSWEMIQPALKTSLAEIYCAKKNIQEAFYNKIKDELLAPLKEAQEKIDQLAHPNCWKSFLPYLKLTLFETEAKLRIPFLKLLEEKSLLSKEDLLLYALKDYLDAPPKGELLNTSWRKIESLGKDTTQRHELLEKLKESTFIPDFLFSLPQGRERTVKVNHLKKNFPEFFPFYIKKCLYFMRGIENFPQGNPTQHCDKIIEDTMAPQWFPEKDLSLVREHRNRFTLNPLPTL